MKKIINTNYKLLYCLCLLFLINITGVQFVFSATIPDNKRVEIDSLLKILPLSESNERTIVLIELSKQYVSFSLDSSKEYARLALSSAKESGNNPLIAETYKLLGNICYFEGNYNNVINLYDSSLIIFKLIGDSAGAAKVWNNLGLIYQNIGDYNKAIEYHLKSLETKIKLNDSSGIAISYNNIGGIYFELKNYEKSYHYFNKALPIAKKLKLDNTTMGVLGNLGLISQQKGDYEKSIDFFNQSISLGEKINYSKGISNAYHNLGRSYFYLGEYTKSLEYYNKTLEIDKKLGIANSKTLNNIAQVYIELDYYNQALKYLNKALEIAKKNNQFNNLKDIYQNFSVCYELAGKYENAYRNHILYYLYDDSLKQQMYSNNLEEIHSRHEIEKKQKEIEKLNLESKLALEQKDYEIRRRNYLIYSFILGLIIVSAFAIVLLQFNRKNKKTNTQLKEQNNEIVRSGKIIKKINKALTENEEMLRSIFDASPYSICVIDEKGTILDCNNSTCKMLHAANKRKIIKKQFKEFVIPEQIEAATKRFKKAFNNETITQDQFILKRKDNTTFQAEISGGMIKDSSGKPKAYVMIITDITERIGFIENLKKAKIEAEESDRLKTAFLANMSHEIRTPMNSIIGFSNLLNEPEIDQSKKEEYLTHILGSGNLLLSLIDDIIDISKIEAGQLSINMQECKINPIINEVFSSFNNSIKNKDVELHINVPAESDALSFKTDPVRLRQILSNLLGNALKFTEKGYIETGYSFVRINSKQKVEFYVKDTGIGIPPEKHDVIFDRFIQIDDSRKRKFGGTGLGLAISKRLVELLGGTIRVESNKGKGSVFYFILPYESLKKEKKTGIEPFQASKYNWKGKTILIAEDENSNYELLKASIYRTKIKIIRAVNGEEAVEFVKNNGKIDIILMDIRMPKMNGYEATRKIKSFKPKLPIVSITAYAMSEDESKSIEAGCDMYISKPIRPAKLLSLINGFFTTS
ncbi:MAG: hypothetical protein B6D61_03900 [Bacteroidetes bacterium 4484_249]|nr:MAG: hypothetical protein B6D61_03900 [Bacteroidetes bacterium 4484_249]